MALRSQRQSPLLSKITDMAPSLEVPIVAEVAAPLQNPPKLVAPEPGLVPYR